MCIRDSFERCGRREDHFGGRRHPRAPRSGDCAMTRVLITGAAGQVGVDLVDVLGGTTPLGGDPGFNPDSSPVTKDEFEVLGLNHHDLDITNRDAVMKAVETAKPDVIVHLAAYTAVDKAETCLLYTSDAADE